MDPKDLLTFRKMVTPAIIQVVFWSGGGLAVIVGLISIVSGLSSTFGGGTQVLGGLLILCLGPLVIRIYCELLILLFRMYDEMQEIRAAITARSASTDRAVGAAGGQ